MQRRIPLCLAAILAATAGSALAATYSLQVTRYADALRLSDTEVDRILQETEKLICRACKKPWPCGIRIQRADRVFFSLEKPGLLSSASVSSLFGQDQTLPVRRVYVTRGIHSCPTPDPLPKGVTIAGCAEQGGNTMFVVLTGPPKGSSPLPPDQSQNRTDKWFQEQARIWAHELAHNLGLCHRRRSTALMNPTITQDSESLNTLECDAFGSRGDRNGRPHFQQNACRPRPQ